MSIVDTILYHYRKNLNSELDKTNPTNLTKCIREWLFALKAWEQADTFDAAFKEKRMTARGCRNAHETNYVHDLMMNSDQAKGVEGGKLWVGYEGIQQRLDPNSFLDGGKGEKGLHSLAAVLLDPSFGGGIQQQLHGDPEYVVFMPLPKMEDLQVQARLSRKAKQTDNTLLLQEIQKVRREMTRIHLASSMDMSTSFYDVGDEKKSKPRYGYAIGSDGGGPKQSDETIREYRDNALHYQRNVSYTDVTNNEVTVKYRKHAGNFPIFTKRHTSGQSCKYVEEKNVFHPINYSRTVANNGTVKTSKSFFKMLGSLFSSESSYTSSHSG